MSKHTRLKWLLLAAGLVLGGLEDASGQPPGSDGAAPGRKADDPQGSDAPAKPAKPDYPQGFIVEGPLPEGFPTPSEAGKIAPRILGSSSDW